MVAFFGLFEHDQIFIEHFFLWERNAVDACQLWAMFVAAPIGAGHAQQFDGFDFAGVWQMWAAAQIDECALSIECDGAIGKFGYEFDFVVFAFGFEHFQCIGFRDVFAHDSLFFGGQFSHFLFDFFQIGFFDDFAIGRFYIVIKAVFDGRSDAKFDAWIQFGERFGQQVRRCVPKGVFGLVVFPFVQFQRAILCYRARQIAHFAIDCGSQHVGRQSWTDAFGYL